MRPDRRILLTRDDIRPRLFVIPSGIESGENQVSQFVKDDRPIAVPEPDKRRLRISSSRGHLVAVVPDFFAGRQLETCQPMLLVDRIHMTVAIKRLRHQPPQIAVFLPDQLGVFLLFPQADRLRTGPVACDEDSAISVNRRGDRDAIQNFIGKSPVDLPRAWVDPQNVFRGPGDQLRTGRRLDDHRRGISGRVVRRAPHLFSADPIECHQAAVFGPCMHDDEVFPDNRGCRQPPGRNFGIEFGDAIF